MTYIFIFLRTNIIEKTDLIDRETLMVESKLYLYNVTSQLHENTFKCKIHLPYNNKLIESNNLYLFYATGYV